VSVERKVISIPGGEGGGGKREGTEVKFGEKGGGAGGIGER